MRKEFLKFKAPVMVGFVVLFVAVFITERFNLYDVKYFDKLMHLSGGIISAWFFSIFFRKELNASSKLKAAIILVSTAGLVGILWEFTEYFSSVYVSQVAPALARYMYIGDLTDTLGDILLDLTGGFGFGLFYFMRLGKLYKK